MDLRSRREVRTRLAAFLDTHVADADALHGAGGIEQRFGRGKAREHVDSQAFSLLSEQRRQLTE